MRLPILAAAMLLLLADQAAATPCPELKRLANSEVKELIATIKDPEADEFDQVAAVEILSCEERKPMRDLAFRAMLRSPNDIVRAEGVFRALADRKSIIVRLRTEEGMSRDQLDFVKAKPEIVYDNYFVDVENRCISLWHVNHAKCEPGSGIVVTRNEVVLRSGEEKVVLESTADGMLVGRYSDRSNKGIPAEIEVY